MAEVYFDDQSEDKNCSLTSGDNVAVVDANVLREPPLETVFHLDSKEHSNKKKGPVVKRGL